MRQNVAALLLETLNGVEMLNGASTMLLGAKLGLGLSHANPWHDPALSLLCCTFASKHDARAVDLQCVCYSAWPLQRDGFKNALVTEHTAANAITRPRVARAPRERRRKASRESRSVSRAPGAPALEGRAWRPR